MTRPSDDRAEQAYTRASVEAYLRAAADERARIESAIAAAQARSDWVRREEERLDARAAATTEAVVDTGAQTGRLSVPAATDANGWDHSEVPTAIAHD
jgi:hypothetical protein